MFLWVVRGGFSPTRTTLGRVNHVGGKVDSEAGLKLEGGKVPSSLGPGVIWA